jgi:type III pantothenate kinase
VLLAIDIGNTNVVVGLLDGEKLVQHWRIATRRSDTSDEVAAILRSLFQIADLTPSCVSDCIVSCVVPPLLPIYERTVQKSFELRPLVVGPGIRTGMPLRVDNPPEVGADRIVNAVAAHHLLGAPVISLDFGTALTFDCVSRAGEFVGGVIFPGVLVALQGLVDHAARLSSVEIIKPPHVVGRNTVQMLQSGMVYGYAGMVDRTVERIREELGSDARTIATGGLAHLVASECKTIERIEPFLTLDGLRLIYERNRDTSAGRRG